MKRLFFLLLIFAFCASVASAAMRKASKKTTIFGPKKYDVVERYGAENRYTETFSASEGTIYIINIRNGEKPSEASDYIEFKLNGQKLVRDDRYAYPFIACVAKLKKQNSFALMLRDSRPVGKKLPKLPARFAVITVTPMSGGIPPGAFGVTSREQLHDVGGFLNKIKAQESRSLAVAALSLANDKAARTEAVRKLADRKDENAMDLLTYLYTDERTFEDIRAEAALALGALRDTKSIPLLMKGLLHNEEKVRVGSARALSFYSEGDTREPFEKTIRQLDAIRMDTVLQSIADAGWKPLGIFRELAQSNDVYVAKAGLKLLGGTGDPGAVEFLLTNLREPKESTIGAVITALGETKDKRALEALSLMAKDSSARKGVEAELGESLAALGDQRSVVLIEDMIKDTSDGNTRRRLLEAYRRLTGKPYGIE